MNLKLKIIAMGVAFTCNADASVYISHDSLNPSPTQKLIQAQVEAQHASTKAMIHMVDQNTNLYANLSKLSSEQLERAQNRMDDVTLERQLLFMQNENNLKQIASIESKKLELDRQSQRNLKEYQSNRNQLAIAQIAQEKKYSQREIQLTKKHLKEQKALNNRIVSMDKRFSDQQDMLLAARIENNAPSNVVVASKDASNLKKTVRLEPYMKGYSGSSAKNNGSHKFNKFSETNSTGVLVNLTHFLKQILPETWQVLAPEELSGYNIQAISGKDWESIVNTIAVEHPYLNFYIDTYGKKLHLNAERELLDRHQNLVTYWYVSVGKTLKSTINDFAKRANWQVIWDTHNLDYSIVANANLQGSFDGDNGVIKQLMQTTANNEIPLDAHFSYANRAVTIFRKGAEEKNVKY